MIYTKLIKDVRKIIKDQKKQNKLIGFVPTMGALHRGHISLIEQAKRETDYVVVSIFVNPIQFGKNEDFDKYPRPIEEDKKICEMNGVDLLFNPEPEEILGNNLLTFVDINEMQNNLCGLKRVGHFRGVCTIVSKLFNIVTPDKAFFGKKDIQQYFIIKKMCYDLNFDIEIIGCPIIRDFDGVALSSRNTYLSEQERKDAVIINKTIKDAILLYEKGEKNSKQLIKFVEDKIKNFNSNIIIDYISVVDENMKDIEIIKDGNILAIAVYIGKTRLIDNHIFGEKICF